MYYGFEFALLPREAHYYFCECYDSMHNCIAFSLG